MDGIRAWLVPRWFLQFLKNCRTRPVVRISSFLARLQFSAVSAINFGLMFCWMRMISSLMWFCARSSCVREQVRQRRSRNIMRTLSRADDDAKAIPTISASFIISSWWITVSLAFSRTNCNSVSSENSYRKIASEKISSILDSRLWTSEQLPSRRVTAYTSCSHSCLPTSTPLISQITWIRRRSGQLMLAQTSLTSCQNSLCLSAEAGTTLGLKRVLPCRQSSTSSCTAAGRRVWTACPSPSVLNQGRKSMKALAKLKSSSCSSSSSSSRSTTTFRLWLFCRSDFGFSTLRVSTSCLWSLVRACYKLVGTRGVRAFSSLRDCTLNGCFLLNFLFSLRQNSARVFCSPSFFQRKTGWTKQLRCSQSSLRSWLSSNWSFWSRRCLTGRTRSSSGRAYSLSRSSKGQARFVARQAGRSASSNQNCRSFSASRAGRSMAASCASLPRKERIELPMRSSASNLINSEQYSSVYLSSSLYFSPLENISNRSSSSTLLLSSTIRMEKMLSPSSSIFCRSKRLSMPMSVSRARSEQTFTPSRRRFRYSASTQGLCSSSRYIIRYTRTFTNYSRQRLTRYQIAYRIGLNNAACQLRDSPWRARRKGAEKRGFAGSKMGSRSLSFRMALKLRRRSWLVKPSWSAKRPLTKAWSSSWKLKQQETRRERGSASWAMSSCCAISMRKTGTMMLQILQRVSMSMMSAAMARARSLISPCFMKLRKNTVYSSCFITRSFSSPEWFANRFRLVSTMFSTSSPSALNSMIRSNTSSWSSWSRSSRVSSAMTAATSSTVGQQDLKKGYFILQLRELNMPAQISESSRKRRLTLGSSRMLTMASMQSLFSSQTGFSDSRFRQRQITMFSTSLPSTPNVLARKSSCRRWRQAGMRRSSCMRMMRKHLRGNLRCSSTQRLLLRQLTSVRILQANSFSSCAYVTARTPYREISASTMRKITYSPFSRIWRRVMSMPMDRSVASSSRISWMLMSDCRSGVWPSGKGMFSRQETTSPRPASSLAPPTRTFSMMARTITSNTWQLLWWKSSFSLLNLFSTILRSAHEERPPWKKWNMLVMKSSRPPATVRAQMGSTSFSRKMPFFARSSWKQISKSSSSRRRRNSPVPMNSRRRAEWKVRKERQRASQKRKRPRRCSGRRGQLASMKAISSSSYSGLNCCVSSCSQRRMNSGQGVSFSSRSLRAALDSAKAPWLCHWQTLKNLLSENYSRLRRFQKLAQFSRMRQSSVVRRSTCPHAPLSSSPAFPSRGNNSGSAFSNLSKSFLKVLMILGRISWYLSRKTRENWVSRQRAWSRMSYLFLSVRKAASSSKRYLTSSMRVRWQLSWMLMTRVALSCPAALFTRSNMRYLQSRKWHDANCRRCYCEGSG